MRVFFKKKKLNNKPLLTVTLTLYTYEESMVNTIKKVLASALYTIKSKDKEDDMFRYEFEHATDYHHRENRKIQ